MRSSLLFLIAVCLHLDGGRSKTVLFDYDPSSRVGVERWSILYKECGADNQSPVNIDTSTVEYNQQFKCPHILYDNNIITGTLTNNGHSTTFIPTQAKAVQICHVPYSGNATYILHDFHVHYGGMLDGGASKNLEEGSEHEVNGQRYTGEFHFVFYNSLYTNLEEALDKVDGVMVVARFVQRMEEPSEQFSFFLTKTMPEIFAIDSSHHTDVDFSMFFYEEFDFYTYNGSTTTPVCHPYIRWVILREPIAVTKQAWSVFGSVELHDDLADHYGNHRPPQPLNGRHIEANFAELYTTTTDAGWGYI